MRRIVLTAVTSAIARVLAAAVPLITVRLALAYLGNDRYGLWMTISSFFALFAFADFGLGSGLHTALSRTAGIGDIEGSRRLTSTTFFLLLAIAGVILLVFGLAYPFIPWVRVLNASTPSAALVASAMVAAIFVPQVINLPLTMVQRTQMALQDGFQSNLWQCVASLISLVMVVFSVHAHVSPVMMVFLVSSTVVWVGLLNWCWFFLLQRPALRPRWNALCTTEIIKLLRTGGAFFILSILTTIGVLAPDNLIVAHLCGLKDVAVFSITSRIAILLSVAINMISAPLWAANGEALANGEVAWVKQNTWRIMMVSAGITISGGVLLVVFGPLAIKIWLGASYTVPVVLLLGLAVSQVIMSVASPLFMVLNAAGAISRQIKMFALFTPLSIVLKIILAKYVGMVGIPWATGVCYGIVIIPQVYISARAIYSPVVPSQRVESHQVVNV